ncbi:SunT ABC-type bacteriocin/lantibiotic exporters, contain an N-terminal double-glycine peptidase domain [Oxalobacteraceae bacterium]
MHYRFSLADFGTLISTALGASASPAEFRSIESVDPYRWTLEELKEIMSSRTLDFNEIDLNEIDFSSQQVQLRETVYVAIAEEMAWIISFDAMTGRVHSVCTQSNADPLAADFKFYFENEKFKWKFFQCNRTQAISLAVLPGIESHWFWSTIWKNRSLYLQSAVAAFMTNFFALGTSLFSMIVYNRIIPSNALESLVVLVSGMGILVLTDHLTRSIRNKFLSFAGVDSDLALADRLFAQVMDLEFKSRKGTVGSLANTLKEFEHIREFFASATLVSLIDVPFAIIFLLAIGFIGGWMIVPVLIGIAVLLLTTFYLQPRMKALAKHSFEDGQSKHSVLVESLTGLETLKLLGAGGFMRRRFRSVLERQADISEQTKEHTHFSGNVAQTVQQLVQIAVVAAGAWLVKDGLFGYGAIIACTILSGKALGPIAQLSQLLVRLNQIRVSYDALNELMAQPIEHPKGHSFLPRGRLRGKIEFKNVSFTYPGQQIPSLDDVSFTIEAGERVAILGHVGSGKTTISRLISGLYAASEGTIRIDGVDIRQIAPAELRENLGIVLQDVWLMSSTIEQNISLGAVELTAEQILEAGRIAGVSDFADRHPDGYKLVLKERGESLSGGQRQAISLARSLVRRPPILLLDEPTSSMDARSEQAFIQRFKQTELNGTLIIITHRTSLLSMVDRVVILEQGKIAGIGTTEQFMRAQTDRVAASDIVRGAQSQPASS